jgi:hypothetical protein
LAIARFSIQRLERPPLAARLVVIVGVLLFFVPAFYLPAFWARGGFFEGGEEIPGWGILAVGWIPLLPFFVPWLANPLLVDALRRFWGGAARAAVTESGFALALGVLPCLYVAFDDRDSSQLLDAYYLWAGSLMVGFVGVSWHALGTGTWRRTEQPATDEQVFVRDQRILAGSPSHETDIRAGTPAVNYLRSHRRPLIVNRFSSVVFPRLIAAMPVGLFAYVQYQWFVHDRRIHSGIEPDMVLGPLYFLANLSPADDWIGYLLLAGAVPCLLAVVVRPRRWTAVLACVTGLAWIVPGCIKAPGGP